jgi:hypothetical protein
MTNPEEDFDALPHKAHGPLEQALMDLSNAVWRHVAGHVGRMNSEPRYSEDFIRSTTWATLLPGRWGKTAKACLAGHTVLVKVLNVETPLPRVPS